MKTVKFISVALAGALLVLSACRKESDKEPEYAIKVTSTELNFTKDGGTQELILNVSNPWEAEVDADWCILSKYKGEKDAFIRVKVVSSSENEATAVIKFFDTRGNSISVTVRREGTGEIPTDKVTDTCNNTYPIVKIGNQYWIAENFRCNKYANLSEAYKEGIHTIPTLKNHTYAPYYTDASDRNNWYYRNYDSNLTDTQIKKLGYLYSWAATVGVVDGIQQTTAFRGNRQGICPNGWHIPSKAEWQALYDYIYKDKSLTSNTIGKYLKTTSGWHSGGNGLDSYGFAALPAGYFTMGGVSLIDYYSYFWTSTPGEGLSGGAYICELDYDNDYLYFYNDNKDLGRSVRCIKN